LFGPRYWNLGSYTIDNQLVVNDNPVRPDQIYIFITVGTTVWIKNCILKILLLIA
jgi:hypothetical protein